MLQSIRKAVTVLSFTASALVLNAQSVPQPGRLAPAAGAVLAAMPVAGISSSHVQITTIAERPDKVANRLWIASMLSMVAATSFDAATSIGKSESNHFLASSNGSFGAKGIGLKAVFAAGVIVPEVLICRHKNYKIKFAIANFVQSALFSAVAVHNLGISNSH